MSTHEDHLEPCAALDDALADVLDGTAPDAVINHLVSCDRCRDARHDAERARDVVASAGDDYVVPTDLVTKVMAKLDARRDDAPVPGMRSAAIVARVRALLDPERPRTWLFAFVAAASVAGAVALALIVTRPTSPAYAPFRGTIALVARASKDEAAGLSICKGSRECRPARMGDVAEPGDRVRTDERTRARLELADGSVVMLDRDTEITLAPKSPRTASITRGLASMEIASSSGSHATIQLPHGRVDAAGGSLKVTATDAMSLVEVTRGEAAIHPSVSTGPSEPAVVRAGHEGRVLAGGSRAVVSTTTAEDSEDLFTADLTKHDSGDVVRGVGQLRAKKPGETKEDEQRVRLAKHHVKVRISGNVARTEIDESFANDSNDELEGIYRMPLPPDAQIERLALEVNGKLEEGAFVARDRAKAIWGGVIQHAAPQATEKQGEIVWVPGPWHDPALLEWQRGGRFELRIFPIPAHGARRVVLAYTQRLSLHAGARRYTYPLAYDPAGSTTIDDFDFDVRVAGHDKQIGLVPRGYTMERAQQQQAEDGADRLHMNARAFVPAGDLSLEYALGSDASELTAWSYVPPQSTLGGDHDPYVAIALRPKLPPYAERREQLYTFVVDSSRSMFGERYKRASSVVGAMVRELDPRDRLLVLACDTECRAVTDGAISPSASAAADIERGLAAILPDGAHDAAWTIGAAIDRGAALRDGKRQVHVVYLGDGGVSAGSLRPDRVAKSLEPIAAKNGATITAVAIGSDADTNMLGSIAHAGGGGVVRDVGQKATALASNVMTMTSGVVLRRPVVKLPPGLHAVAGASLDPIAEGGEAFLVARVDPGAEAARGTIELDGDVGGEAYHQTFPLDARLVTSSGNAFLPRLYAAMRITDLEREQGDRAREEIVRLSREHHVASRLTSLLVLESEAMFRAYGIDRGKNLAGATSWTGEEASVSTNAEGDLHAAGSTTTPPPSFLHPRPAGRPTHAPNACDVPFTIDPTGRKHYRVECLSDAPPPPPPPNLVPMRRTFVRHGAFSAAESSAPIKMVSAAEAAIATDPNSRTKTSVLVRAYAAAGRVEDAATHVREWLARDPLDLEALLLRSELAARSGDRHEELRSLAGMVDLEPSDVQAQLRLARVLDARGDTRQACAHRVSAAEGALAALPTATPTSKVTLKPETIDAIAGGLRCARDDRGSDLASDLLASLASLGDDPRKKIEDASSSLTAPDAPLRGDVQLKATWDGAIDVDISLIDSAGRRYAWTSVQGGPNVQDATSTSRESIAWTTLPPDTYTIELTRPRTADVAPVTGTIEMKIVDRTIPKTPFTLTGARAAIGTLTITREERLVPVVRTFNPFRRNDIF